MDGSLRLNDYDIKHNPAAGAHDPSMMWDPVTEKYYSYSTDVDGVPLGLPKTAGIPVRSSMDLIHFKYEGTALSREAVAQAADNGTYPETKSFWAPFVEYVHGEYRMYYSATKAFGSSQSRIWLAVSGHPLGPFENRGIVADTWGTDDTFPNAIDPHIVWDGKACYLVYGSFFGGIYMKPLDPETGMPLDGNPKTLGICISRKSKVPVIDGPEGGAVIYVPETGYYYLFQSYGWLGEDYDIRVGRSRCVTGPYVDYHNKHLVGEALGLKIAGSYRFDAQAVPAGQEDPGWCWDGFYGPGHGVPFFDPVRGNYFFVHHIRDGAKVNRTFNKSAGRASYKRHYLMVRPMFFVDGWPVLGPEPYSGREFTPAPYGGHDTAPMPDGGREFTPALYGGRNTVPVPDGGREFTSVPYSGRSLRPVFSENGAGMWAFIRFDEADNGQKRSFKKVLTGICDDPAHVRLFKCFDFENQKDTMAVSGIDESGIAYWGKLLYHNV